MKVKPTGVEDGILLYSSETEEGHGDFISLAIREKHLEFRFDAGNGEFINSCHKILNQLVKSRTNILSVYCLLHTKHFVYSPFFEILTKCRMLKKNF